MRWRAAVIALVLAGAVTEACAQDRAELWRRCEEPDIKWDERFASCTALIESARESVQDLAVAFYHRGLLYHWDERNKAIVDQSEAIRLNPWFVDAYIARGQAYTGEREYDSAIHDFDEAIRLDPREAKAFLGRGDAYLERRIYREAIRDFDEAIRLDVNLSAAYDKRHMAYNGLGHPAAWFNDPNAWAYGCGILMKETQYDQAMDHCNKALAIWPNQPSALFLRGLMLLKGGRPDAAIADLDRTLQRDRWSRSASFTFALRGAAHFSGGRMDEAIKDFDAALKLEEDSALALYGRGLARQRKGDVAGGADIAAAKTIYKDVEERAAEFGVK